MEKPELRDALGLAFDVGIEEPRQAIEAVVESGDPWDVLQAIRSGHDDRREAAVKLLSRGEVSHARRYATCSTEGVQLLCPDGIAGGCGFEDNYVPITCDSRLCEDCGRRRMGELTERYTEAVHGMEKPTYLTLTVENVADAEEGVDRLVDGFGRLRRRSIPTRGETEREGATKRWAWQRDRGRPAELWKPHLTSNGDRELARHLQKRYVRQGRGIPWDELVSSGFYAVDIKQKGESEWNVHLHAIVDAVWMPQAALSAVWEDVTGCPVVDVRRIYSRDGDAESAVLETVAYSVKPPETESIDAAVDVVVSLKNRRLVQPFGDLHGNTPTLSRHLRCQQCEQVPAWWVFCGVVENYVDGMGMPSGADGDRPPDGAGSAAG